MFLEQCIMLLSRKLCATVIIMELMIIIFERMIISHRTRMYIHHVNRSVKYTYSVRIFFLTFRGRANVIHCLTSNDMASDVSILSTAIVWQPNSIPYYNKFLYCQRVFGYMSETVQNCGGGWHFWSSSKNR